MAPQGRSSIAPAQTGVTSAPNLNLGKNAQITNTVNGGLDIGSLQVKTKSIISSGLGLNINPIGDNSSLTIDSVGNLKTDGLIDSIGSMTTASSLNSKSINVNGTNLTVADTGDLTTIGKVSALGDLSIGSKFGVIASSGAVTTGTVSATGTITVGGTTASPNLTLANDGKITAVNDLSIGSGNFTVTALNGNVSAAGNLAINGTKFTVAAASGNVHTDGNVDVDGNVHVDGNVSAVGTLSATGDLAINGTKFTVAAASGNVSSAGTLSATGDLAINGTKFTVAATSGDVSNDGKMSVKGDLAINVTKFTVAASSGDVHAKGDLSINDKFKVQATTGKAESDLLYTAYTPNASSLNTLTTEFSGVEPVFDSATNKYLTTQEYVDKQIWVQTKRLNTILGSDDAVQTIQSIYGVISAIAGNSDVVTTLNSVNDKYDNLVDRQSEVNTSLSTAVSQAVNTFLVNCTPTVWADACGPMPIPNTITSKTIEDGWYFSNLTAGNKINWYMPSNGVNMTVADVQNLYLNVFAASDVSLPFITIYTATKGANDYWPGLANARINYVFSAASPSSTANKPYCLYTGAQPMNVYNKTFLKSLSVLTTNGANRNNADQGSVGTSIDNLIVLPTDKILAFTISTDSGSSAGNVSAVINSLNVCIKTGTTQFTFSNAGVVSNYLFNYFFSKNTDFTAFPAPALQGSYVDKYNQTFNSN
jgi:cytoskeletal protein CcmA (bactofilin family)